MPELYNKPIEIYTDDELYAIIKQRHADIRHNKRMFPFCVVIAVLSFAFTFATSYTERGHAHANVLVKKDDWLFMIHPLWLMYVSMVAFPISFITGCITLLCCRKECPFGESLLYIAMLLVISYYLSFVLGYMVLCGVGMFKLFMDHYESEYAAYRDFEVDYSYTIIDYLAITTPALLLLYRVIACCGTTFATPGSLAMKGAPHQHNAIIEMCEEELAKREEDRLLSESSDDDDEDASKGVTVESLNTLRQRVNVVMRE